VCNISFFFYIPYISNVSNVIFGVLFYNHFIVIVWCFQHTHTHTHTYTQTHAHTHTHTRTHTHTHSHIPVHRLVALS